MPLFRGSFVALITPFDQRGRIDAKSLEKLVEWHIQEGTDGIVCCGTTGEAPTLTEKEKKRVAEICIKTASKKIPIVVGTGTSSTRQSHKLSLDMLKLGADGALVVTPYYNKPSQRGVIAHFQEVAKAGLPIIAYNNPGRASVKLTAETIAEIGRVSGVVAIKDSSHDLELIRKVRQISSLPILSGEDDLTFETIQEGGVGAISVIGNLIPKAWKEMIDLALSKKEAEAKKLAKRCLPLCSALFRETNPQGVKFCLEWMGKSRGVLRLPLVEVLKETQEELIRALLYTNLYFSPSDPKFSQKLSV